MIARGSLVASASDETSPSALIWLRLSLTAERESQRTLELRLGGGAEPVYWAELDAVWKRADR